MSLGTLRTSINSHLFANKDCMISTHTRPHAQPRTILANKIIGSIQKANVGLYIIQTRHLIEIEWSVITASQFIIPSSMSLSLGRNIFAAIFLDLAAAIRCATTKLLQLSQHCPSARGAALFPLAQCVSGSAWMMLLHRTQIVIGLNPFPFHLLSGDASRDRVAISFSASLALSVLIVPP